MKATNLLIMMIMKVRLVVRKTLQPGQIRMILDTLIKIKNFAQIDNFLYVNDGTCPKRQTL